MAEVKDLEAAAAGRGRTGDAGDPGGQRRPRPGGAEGAVAGHAHGKRGAGSSAWASC